MRPVFLAFVCLLLAGCTTEETRFGEVGPEPGFRNNSEAFCRNYARQTARNTAENLYDPEDGIGASVLAEQDADRAYDEALRRCRSGRLN